MKFHTLLFQSIYKHPFLSYPARFSSARSCYSDDAPLEVQAATFLDFHSPRIVTAPASNHCTMANATQDSFEQFAKYAHNLHNARN